VSQSTASTDVVAENGAPTVADENDLLEVVDEPSPEEFEAAERIEPPVGARAVVFRIARAIGTLLLIVALLLYFVAPFRNAVIRVLDEWHLPLQSIPLAPGPPDNPKLPS